MAQEADNYPKKALAVMTVNVHFDLFLGTNLGRQVASQRIHEALLHAQGITKTNGGVVTKSNYMSFSSLMGANNNNRLPVVDACFSAIDIVKYFNVSGIFKDDIYYINGDIKGEFSEFAGRFLSIGISSGSASLEYTEDEKYSYNGIVGEAAQRSERIASCPFDQYPIVVDASAFHDLERSGGVNLLLASRIGFSKVKSLRANNYVLRGPFYCLDDIFIPSEKDNGFNSLPSENAVPKQMSLGLNFSGDVNKPITITEQSASGLLNTEDQQQSYDDIKHKSEEIIKDCGERNRLSRLKSCVNKLVISMGEGLQDLKVRAFWSQMNSLRRQLEADDRARQSVDPDYPSLPENISASLGDLVDLLNVFSAHEPKLIELDELKRDPAERLANDAALSAAIALTERAVTAPQLVSPDAAESLKQLAEDAIGSTPASDRAKEFSVKSVRNLALELVRIAYKAVSSESGTAVKGIREGMYRGFGNAGGMYGAALLVSALEMPIRMLVNTLGGNPTLHRIIDLIIKYVN